MANKSQSAETIRDYLVSVGFQLDEQDYKKFDAFLLNVQHRFSSLAKEAAGTALIVGTAVNKMASGLEDLYFQSIRTGTSASSLKAWSFAAQQVGISADSANAAIDNFAEALRAQPGNAGFLKSLGIDPDQADKTLLLLQTVQQIYKQYGYAAGKGVAANLGISQDVFLALGQQGPDFITQYQKQLEFQKKVNPALDETTKKAHEQQEAWRTTKQEFESVAEKAGTRLIPELTKLIERLNKLLDIFFELDEKSSGWLSTITAIVTALGALKVAAGLGRLLGIGGTVAEGAAATEGTGALGLLGPAGIALGVAGVGAYEVNKHSSDIKGWLKKKFGYNWDDDSGGVPQGGVDEALIRAIGRVESGNREYDKNGNVIVSKAGAIGHMQLMPKTAAGLGVNPYNEQENIAGGTRLIQQLYDKYKDMKLALEAYNWGEGKLDKALAKGTSIPQEVQDYADTVLRLADRTRLSQSSGGVKAQLNHETNITVQASPSAEATGRAIAREQVNVYGNAYRNMGPALQ